MKNSLWLLLAVCMLVSCKKSDTNTVVQQPVMIYQDNLTVNLGKWAVDSTAVHVKKFIDGHYLIEVDSAPNIISYSLAPCDSINFSYSVQLDAIVQFSSPGVSGNVGIVFNWLNNKNYCVAEITSKGNYRIWQKIEGSIYSIQSSTSSDAIHTGNSAANTIKIIQQSDVVQMIINGTSMGSFDCAFPGVFVKVGLSTSTNQNAAKGLFNNFILEKI